MCAAETQKPAKKPEGMASAFAEAIGGVTVDRSEEKTPFEIARNALEAVGAPATEVNRGRAMALQEHGMEVTAENLRLPLENVKMIGRQGGDCSPEEALSSLGMPASEENLSLVKLIRKAGWPVGRETVENATVLREHGKEVTDRLLRHVRRLRKLEFLLNEETLGFTDQELRVYSKPLESPATFYAAFHRMVREERGSPVGVDADNVAELNDLIDVAPIRVKKIIEAMMKPGAYDSFQNLVSSFAKTTEGMRVAARLGIELKTDAK